MSALFDPDLLAEIREAYAEHDKHLDNLAEKCDNEVKIAVVRWAMKHIVDHAKEGGTYRYLIYDRMGFGPEAYAPLCSDGITISNDFDINQMNDVKKMVKEHKIDVLKKTLFLCDETDCYNEITCGWTSDDGYRSTCGLHYIKDK
jgi:hypothetical protein